MTQKEISLWDVRLVADIFGVYERDKNWRAHDRPVAKSVFKIIVLTRGYPQHTREQVTNGAGKTIRMKDYYAMLGVLPSIDQSALKAVYSALMKKYHPDVTKMPKDQAELRAKEINEAYSVLGDPAKRAEYDAQRKQSFSQSGDYNQESSDYKSAGHIDDEFVNDWSIVINHFPEVESHRRNLIKISPALAQTFQVLVITEKLARQSADLAKLLERDFLRNYFGSNERIHKFVLFLIESDATEVLRDINQYVKVLGTPPDDEVDEFIVNLMGKFGIKKYGFYALEEKPVVQSAPIDGGGSDDWNFSNFSNKERMETESYRRLGSGLLITCLVIVFGLILTR